MPAPAASSRTSADDVRHHLPNALTILRLVLALGFFSLIHAALTQPSGGADGGAALAGARWWLLAGAVVFVLAALTDALDGYLARRWGAITLFGRVMDPFADKILVLGALISLASPHFQLDPPGGGEPYQATGVTPWMVIAVLARELLVTSIRAVYEREGIDFSAAWSGKAKMVLQSLSVPLILVLVATMPAWPGTPARWAILAVVWAMVLVTVASGLPYVVRAFDAAGGSPPGTREGGRLLSVTVLGLGLVRPFPGTWGSLPVPLLIGMIWLGGGSPSEAFSTSWVLFHLTLLVVLLGASGVCVVWGRWAEARFARPDPGQVVADETAGQVIPFLFLPAAAWGGFWQMAGTLAAGFVLFRALDIVKPPPANQSQRLPGGWGILADDLIAGAMALAIMQLAWRVFLT